MDIPEKFTASYDSYGSLVESPQLATWIKLKKNSNESQKKKEAKNRKKRHKHQGPELMMLAMYNLFLEFAYLWNFFYDV